MHILLLGANGATGKHILADLLQDTNVDAITLVLRQPLQPADADVASKITKQVIVPDFADLETSTTVDDWRADVIINALGTTRERAGGVAGFVRIERDYSQMAMRMAKRAGVARAVTLSSVGANKDMPLASFVNFFLYLKTMGEKEQAALSQQFQECILFQPGALERHMASKSDFPWLTTMMPQPKMSVKTYARAVAKVAAATPISSSGVVKHTGNDAIVKLVE